MQFVCGCYIEGLDSGRCSLPVFVVLYVDRSMGSGVSVIDWEYCIVVDRATLNCQLENSFHEYTFNNYFGGCGTQIYFHTLCCMPGGVSL